MGHPPHGSSNLPLCASYFHCEAVKGRSRGDMSRTEYEHRRCENAERNKNGIGSMIFPSFEKFSNEVIYESTHTRYCGIMMNRCTKCEYEFTATDEVLGYWAGWKATCPKCKTVAWAAYKNRYRTMLITVFPAFLIAVIISLSLFDAVPPAPLIVIVLSIPFSLGAPLVIKFTETEKPKMFG